MRLPQVARLSVVHLGPLDQPERGARVVREAIARRLSGPGEDYSSHALDDRAGTVAIGAASRPLGSSKPRRRVSNVAIHIAWLGE